MLAAQLVQHRRRPGVGGAVLLDQVEPGERHIEPRVFGELEHHELDVEAVLLDLLQAVVAADAVLDVDDIVADREIAEVRDEGCGLRLGARGHGRAATSASSERSFAPMMMSFASGKLTPLAMAVRTMMGVRMSPPR